MSFTPGPPENDDYAPLSQEQVKAGLDAIDWAQRSWWRRAIALPCFVVLAGAQVVRRWWQSGGRSVMTRDESIALAKEIVSGAGIDRRNFPETGKASLARDNWHEPVFEIGMEYGYLLCLINLFDIKPEDIWGREVI